MSFLMWAIIYIIIFILFNIYCMIDKKKRKIEYIQDNNIIKAKVIGNVIAKINNNEEHHAVLAYIINDEMHKKECLNGLGKKLHEIGDIVDIKYNENNVEEIELLEKIEDIKKTKLESIIFIILIISIILMFLFQFIL